MSDPLLNIEVLGMIRPRKPSPTGWYDMRGEPMTQEDMDAMANCKEAQVVEQEEEKPE